MNRKYNPMVSLVALLLLAVILVLTCTGCAAEAAEAAPVAGSNNVTAENAETEPRSWIGTRFEFDYSPDGWPYMSNVYVITDTETGVQYLVCESKNGVGLCKLEG